MLKLPTLGIISGASRGIGRAIAIELAKKVGPASTFYLTARSMESLEETAHVIKRDVDKKLDIRCVSIDMSDERSVSGFNKSIFSNVGDISRFSHAVLVHNAGSIGIIDKKARELHDISAIQNYFFFNMTAPITLTSAFLQHLANNHSKLRKTVVQITSLSVTAPQKSMHLYCTGKAGREIFFRVMALEEPDVKILSYDPGLVNTDLYTGLQSSTDTEMRMLAKNLSGQPFFLSPQQSAETLCNVLEEDKYESGSIVRAYEVMNIDVGAFLNQG